MSGAWIIAGIASPRRAAVAARRGTRARPGAGSTGRHASPRRSSRHRPPGHADPSRGAEHQNGERKGEAEGDVRIAFAEAPSEPVFRVRIVYRHDVDGNLSACEKFRKQGPDLANLCGAWEYDMLT